MMDELTDEEAAEMERAIYAATGGDLEVTPAEARAIYAAARELTKRRNLGARKTLLAPTPVLTVPAEMALIRQAPKDLMRKAVDLAAGRYVTDRPRYPLYVPVNLGPENPAVAKFMHWPVLTPDGGILMASTDSDADRFCATLNELTARVAE